MKKGQVREHLECQAFDTGMYLMNFLKISENPSFTNKELGRPFMVLKLN